MNGQYMIYCAIYQEYREAGASEMEYWNNGSMEVWNNGIMGITLTLSTHSSNLPTFQSSIASNSILPIFPTSASVPVALDVPDYMIC